MMRTFVLRTVVLHTASTLVTRTSRRTGTPLAAHGVQRCVWDRSAVVSSTASRAEHEWSDVCEKLVILALPPPTSAPRSGSSRSAGTLLFSNPVLNEDLVDRRALRGRVGRDWGRERSEKEPALKFDSVLGSSFLDMTPCRLSAARGCLNPDHLRDHLGH